MKTTKAHLDYWAARHAPSWHKGTLPSIHGLIPMPKTNTDTSFAASNLCGILRLIRKHKPSLRPDLERIAKHPGTIINPKRRAAFAQKWLERIDR